MMPKFMYGKRKGEKKNVIVKIFLLANIFVHFVCAKKETQAKETENVAHDNFFLAWCFSILCAFQRNFKVFFKTFKSKKNICLHFRD
jgi:hypothetical protein